MIKKISRSAQEEMVGFAIIIIIVAVILLVFLSIYLLRPSKTSLENYEVKSFINSFLEYTTSCESARSGYLPVRDVIFECDGNKTCLNNQNSCFILNTTLREILKESWFVGEEGLAKGYALNITVNGRNTLSLKEGNRTANSKGYREKLVKRGSSSDILFITYT